MYHYDSSDRLLVQQRIAQFRDQLARYHAGELDEESFKQLRLRNGLYLQTHAYMLRVAIPYGLLSSDQLRALADVATRYDRGYGHITTRQNIQYNWPELDDVPDILSRLAQADMHAIQTSGNCIRNLTSDALAGVGNDEVDNPLVWCELIRQWSTLHPEFNWLPRKFKIAVTGSSMDRAAVLAHDIGLQLQRDNAGQLGFRVFVGGGLGRTPVIGQALSRNVAATEILSYLDAILRVYNTAGRRDNKYKARIKILVQALGLQEFEALVEQEWQQTRREVPPLDEAAIKAMRAQFHVALPPQESFTPSCDNIDFRRWYSQNVVPHKVPGYRAVHISLKAPNRPAGDITDTQMNALADIADQYSLGALRTTHDQNIVLPYVASKDLEALWNALSEIKLTTANRALATDMIACPGLDFCSLANAGTLDVYDDIYREIDNIDYLHDLGEVSIKVSGCMNACGHHHIGNIGILGVEKGGKEWYQLTLGGREGFEMQLGKRLGPAVPKTQIASSVRTLLDTYLNLRENEESFTETFDRVGVAPFKEILYAAA